MGRFGNNRLRQCNHAAALRLVTGFVGLVLITSAQVTKGASSQIAVTLQVENGNTGQVMADVGVEKLPSESDKTDANGRVSWEIPLGEATEFRLSKTGFYRKSIVLNPTTADVGDADSSLTRKVTLHPIEDFLLEVEFVRESQTGMGRNQPIWGDKTLQIGGKSYQTDKTAMTIPLHYQALMTERLLLGDQLEVSARTRGYLPTTQRISIDALLYYVDRSASAATQTLRIQLPMQRDPDAALKEVQLALQFLDVDTKTSVRSPVQVQPQTLSPRSSRTGRMVIPIRQSVLDQLRWAGEDYFSVQVNANSHAAVTKRISLDALLRSLWDGSHRHSVDILMKRKVTSPAIQVHAVSSQNNIVKDDAVAVQYTVTNTGDTPLRDVKIADSHCTAVDDMGGDDNADGWLDIKEVWRFECLTTHQLDAIHVIQVSGTSGSGVVVKHSYRVPITVQDCPGSQLEIPHVLGFDSEIAVQSLLDSGFTGPTIQYEKTDQYPEGTVMRQIPAPGECVHPQLQPLITVALKPAIDTVTTHGQFRAELDCGASFEITAGARPSKICGVVVRGWAYSDDHVNVTVITPPGSDLDVWPGQDSAWPPNMAHPGVADVELKRRYIFSLFFSASETATPGLVPVQIQVSQAGMDTINLDVDVEILAVGMLPSRGEGIRPPAVVVTGSGEFCVWRHKSFGEPPACFDFNIAECGTDAYDLNNNYELVAANMTKIQASARMWQLSRYGSDAYGCLAQLTAADESAGGTRTCPDGQTVPEDQPCPPREQDPPPIVCPNGTTVPPDQQCPPEVVIEEQPKTCPDGSPMPASGDCPDPDPTSQGDPQLDCSAYGPHAEMVFHPDYDESVCQCKPGYVFHVTDRCVLEADVNQCLNYPGTYPRGDYCECTVAGEVWSDQLGSCVAPADFPPDEMADCAIYPGTVPVMDHQTGELACSCIGGTQWSDQLGRCVTAAEEAVADLDCSAKPGTEAQIDYFTNTAVCRCPAMDEAWDANAGACVSQHSGGGPGGGIGDMPDPDPPEEVQQGQCNDRAEQGSDNPVRIQIDISGETQVSLTYDTESIKDRVRAFLDGSVVHDSGCVGTSGDVTEAITIPPGAAILEVDVYPNCEGDTGTHWSFTVSCGVP